MDRVYIATVLLLVRCAACAQTQPPVSQQDWFQRGTLEYRGWGFPDTIPDDRAHVVGEASFRYEFWRTLFTPGLKIYGETETRIDSHHQVQREFFVNIDDRRLQRQPFNIRRATLAFTKKRFTLEAGKQVIRWNRTEILNPIDRFAPRDYLTVFDTELLGIIAARAAYDSKTDTIELVVQPRFTPSRLPLVNQRWNILPESTPRYPGGTAWGARWTHKLKRFESGLNFYNGHNYVPTFDAAFIRMFPQLTEVGGDFALALKKLTIRGEAAYFHSTASTADEYILWVLQGEKHIGPVTVVAGYAGESVTTDRRATVFAPDRGLARSFLGRTTWAPDTSRSLATQLVIHQNGKGLWTRFEYTQTFGQHWTLLTGYNLLRGEPTDFIGQYRRNSHAFMTWRLTF